MLDGCIVLVAIVVVLVVMFPSNYHHLRSLRVVTKLGKIELWLQDCYFRYLIYFALLQLLSVVIILYFRMKSSDLADSRTVH